jgi:DNA-binding IclR family transcriptional regulator
VTLQEVQDQLQWTEERALRALQQLLRAGVAWRDDVDGSYWFPAIFMNTNS